ncbi:MAG: T9SS type A sorting domain-containing protein [Winogradskyella sp.]|uniref:T9SS type A sorting domain-containing protein n=1 Tax=Winogradskyella sp. TaxID=1883156 RepID=UPI00385899DF
MKKTFSGFLIVMLCACFNVSAQETIKVMFYNVLNYPLEDAVPNRINDLSVILNDYQPDLFLVCELNNIDGALAIFNTTQTAINSNFEMATYVSNTSDDNGTNQNDLQNLLYYDSTKFTLEAEIIVPTDLRDFNVYKLQLNTIDQDINPVELYVVVCHLKASSGTVNAQRRFDMVVELEAYLNTLPTDVNVLLGGDLNLYTANESAFQELLDTSNAITFTDPVNRVGSWSNNSSFVDVFTQSTRTAVGFGGTRGGFDDRFDFILTSENMLGSSNLNYVSDSYQVFGNNGLTSCYNQAINSSDCETTGSEFQFDIRNALHNFSDHLPVTLTLETAASFLSVDEVNLVSGFYLEATVVTNHLVLHVTDADLFNKHLQIYNSLGQLVKTFQMTTNSKQYFEVSDLQDGLFFLNVAGRNANPIKFIISN